MGPVNTFKLCKNACIFYRMKEKHEKALEKGELEKADLYLLRKTAASVGIRRAAEKIAAKTGVCDAENIEARVKDLEEYYRPDCRIEKGVAWAGAMGLVAGFASSTVGIIGVSAAALVVSAFIYWQITLTDFAGTIYRFLEEKALGPEGDMGRVKAAFEK